MSQILRVAEERGYKVALDSATKDPELANYVLSSMRIDWLTHCYNGSARGLCLDLGSGWGSLSFELTKFFDEVVSLELVPLRREFQAIRAKEDQKRNISLVAADMLSLPFAGDQFELVAANGVLEWAAFSRNQNPRSVQLGFLRDIRRCLRPGGCLYIGIENRFGLDYWFGATDHTGLPFTSLLPRGISDSLVSRLLRDRGWTRYHTYTYSFLGYASLLKEAGYDPVQLYWTYPSYSFPQFAGRLCDGDSYSFLARHYARFEDMPKLKRLASLMAGALPPRALAGILPLVWPSFLIFAWKDFRRNPIDGTVAEAVGADSVVRMSGMDGSSNISVIALKNGRTQSFSKLSRYQQNDVLEKEMNLTAKYAGVRITKIPCGTTTLFTEDLLRGRPCRWRSPEDNSSVVRWLLQFQEETASKPFNRDDAETEKRAIESGLCLMDRGDLTVRETMVQIEELMSILVSSGLRMCSEHGDLWDGNIFISNRGEVFVFDWEFHKSMGNALFDFCFFITSNSLRPRRSEELLLKNLSGSGPYSKILRRLVHAYCSHWKLPTQAVLMGIPYVLSRCAFRYSVYSNTYSPINEQYRRLLKAWNDRARFSDFSWLGDQSD
jgi:SAM-dependent methyltransferase/thiamine kinase-like enzyme